MIEIENYSNPLCRENIYVRLVTYNQKQIEIAKYSNPPCRKNIYVRLVTYNQKQIEIENYSNPPCRENIYVRLVTYNQKHRNILSELVLRENRMVDRCVRKNSLICDLSHITQDLRSTMMRLGHNERNSSSCTGQPYSFLFMSLLY